MNEGKFTGKTYGRAPSEGNSSGCSSGGSDMIGKIIITTTKGSAKESANVGKTIRGPDIPQEIGKFGVSGSGGGDKATTGTRAAESALQGNKSIILNFPFKPGTVPKGTKITITDQSGKGIAKKTPQGLTYISKTGTIIRPASPHVSQMPLLAAIQPTSSIKTLVVTPAQQFLTTSSPSMTKMSGKLSSVASTSDTTVISGKPSTPTESAIVSHSIVATTSTPVPPATSKPVQKDDHSNGSTLLSKTVDKLHDGMMVLTLPPSASTSSTNVIQTTQSECISGPAISNASAVKTAPIMLKSLVTTAQSQPKSTLYQGLKQIPKDTIVKQISTRDLIDIKKMIMDKVVVSTAAAVTVSATKTNAIPTTVTPITQKPAATTLTFVNRSVLPNSGGSIITIPLSEVVKPPTNQIASNCVTTTSKMIMPGGKLPTAVELGPPALTPISGDNGGGTQLTQKMYNFQISNGKISEVKMIDKDVTKRTVNAAASDEATFVVSLMDNEEIDVKQEAAEVADEENGKNKTEIEENMIKIESIDCDDDNDDDDDDDDDDALMIDDQLSPVADFQERSTANNGQTSVFNKFLENVKKSPRLQNRSKSLTNSSVVINRRPYKRRKRLPSAPLISLSPNSIATFADNGKPNSYIRKLQKPPDIKAEKQNMIMFDALKCTENLDESDKSKSVSPIESRIIPIKIGSSSSQWHPDDPSSYVKWKAGIGYLYNSHLHFKLNEFRLIEILDVKDFAEDRIDRDFEDTLNSCRAVYKSHDAAPYICRVCYKSCNKELCTIECSVVHNARQNKLKARQEQAAIAALVLKNKQMQQAITNRTAAVGGKDSVQESYFSWDKYLKMKNSVAAPINLFINPFPSTKNKFEVDMKLEAIDPNNSSFFCVCTIVDKQGYRIKLRFDGYDTKYDFWKNADSMEIFPPGWCTKIGRQLQVPPGYLQERFDWSMYLKKYSAPMASRSLFTHLNSMKYPSNFKIGMKLEAEDKKSRRKLRVASIGAILYNRILIQFDGYNESHDYWTDMSSPYIHPVNFHMKTGLYLAPPPEFANDFKWANYLKAKQAEAVPDCAFVTRNPIGFQVGQKLEIVDRKVPALIRPATITQVRDYEIQVLYDGWPTNYAYWIEDDNPDIHPVNWCAKTGHVIELPAVSNYCKFNSSCGVLGCRELGNAKYPDMAVHNSLAECPYESRNWTNSNDTNRLAEYYQQRKSNAQRFRAQSRSILKTYNPKRMKFEQMDTVLDGISRIVVSPDPIPATTVFDTAAVGHHSPLDLPDVIELEKRINISRGILERYGPRMQEKYDLWKTNTMKLEEKIKRGDNLRKNPIKWSVEDVAEYVAQIHKSVQIPQLFRENEIDGMAFLSLSQDDLMDVLHLRAGPSIKIYNQIVTLREEVMVNYL